MTQVGPQPSPSEALILEISHSSYSSYHSLPFQPSMSSITCHNDHVLPDTRVCICACTSTVPLHFAVPSASLSTLDLLAKRRVVWDCAYRASRSCQIEEGYTLSYASFVLCNPACRMYAAGTLKGILPIALYQSSSLQQQLSSLHFPLS